MPLGAVAIVLAGVFTWSLSMINIRQMGDAGERNVTIVAWYSLGTAALAAFGCITDWVTPSPWQLATLVGAGLMSGLAQWLMTEGYRAAETTLVAPFEYGAIIYASVLGIAIWGEWPDVWSLAGDRGADRVGAVYLAPRGDAGAAAVARCFPRIGRECCSPPMIVLNMARFAK